jgi:phage N-6-adenine-methyltransferase
MIAGFKAANHPLQVARDGAVDHVDDRATPSEDFAAWSERFGGFTLDVAAAPHNAKCERFYTREDDGLTRPWSGRVWCNPPYSNLGAWVSKAWSEWGKPRTELIAMLVPANRAEQRWWQEQVEPYRDRPDSPLRTEFLPGRIRFVFPPHVPAPKHNRPLFGCVLLVWSDMDKP